MGKARKKNKVMMETTSTSVSTPNVASTNKKLMMIKTPMTLLPTSSDLPVLTEEMTSNFKSTAMKTASMNPKLLLGILPTDGLFLTPMAVLYPATVMPVTVPTTTVNMKSPNTASKTGKKPESVKSTWKLSAKMDSMITTVKPLKKCSPRSSLDLPERSLDGLFSSLL